MFNKPSIADFFRVRFSSAKTEIAQKSDGYLVSINFDEFIDYLISKFGILPITIDSERETSLEKIRKTQRMQNRLDEETQMDVLFVRINIPVVPNDEINHLLEFLPSSFSLSMPKVTYNQGWILTETVA